MSDYWYWRLIPCKETGSCNCFATANQSNEEKEEDTNPQVVVSDIMQLVQDKQEVPESAAGDPSNGRSSCTNNHRCKGGNGEEDQNVLLQRFRHCHEAYRKVVGDWSSALLERGI